MARAPMVTRTILTTKVTLMTVNTTTAEVENMEIVLPRTYADDNAVLKAARKVAETEEVKVVSVVRTAVNETLYGMSEADFIAHAKALPPRKESTADADTVDAEEGVTSGLIED